MASMYFQIAQTSLFLEHYFWHLGVPREQFGFHEKLSWECKEGQIRCRAYMSRYVVMGGEIGPQLYYRTSYRLKC